MSNHQVQDTKIGSIPLCWKVAKLESITSKVGSGITPRGGSKTYLDEGVPFIRSQNVLVGKLDISDVAFISDEQHEEMSSTHLEPMDVLLNISGASIGRSCIVPQNIKEGNVNQHVCIIRPTNKIDSYLLSSILNSDIGQKQIWQFQAGGNRQGLNHQQIRSFTIPLPPLPEQHKIADVLSTWDEAIAKAEQLIAALERRKKGLMQRMLTPPGEAGQAGEVRFAGFDGEWVHSFIENCCDILDNQRIPLNNEERAKRQGKIPYFGANGVLDYIDDYIFDEPLILMAEDGGYFDEASYRPICQLIDGKSWVNNHAHVLRAKPGIVREWVFYWFVHRNITPYINAGTRSKLNQKDLRKLPIRLPSYEEQKKISEILMASDNVIELHERKLQLLQQQKKGLMQRLLTGQVRVKV
jgi:type I restriction enzyme S subunit